MGNDNSAFFPFSMKRIGCMFTCFVLHCALHAGWQIFRIDAYPCFWEGEQLRFHLTYLLLLLQSVLLLLLLHIFFLSQQICPYCCCWLTLWILGDIFLMVFHLFVFISNQMKNKILNCLRMVLSLSSLCAFSLLCAIKHWFYIVCADLISLHLDRNTYKVEQLYSITMWTPFWNQQINKMLHMQNSLFRI